MLLVSFRSCSRGVPQWWQSIKRWTLGTRVPAGSFLAYSRDPLTAIPAIRGCGIFLSHKSGETRSTERSLQKFRSFSSSTNLEHEVLRSKMKLFETPSDEHTLLVVQPEFKTGSVENPYVPAKRKLDEAVSLAEAITGWKIHQQRIDAVRKPHSRTFFGRGKIAELQSVVRGLPVTAVYINVPHLMPVQHKVLEEIFEREVFDRFGIVLRIFKERARTKEAKLQVELAEIPYLRAHLLEEEGHYNLQGRGGREGKTGGGGGGGESNFVAAKRNLHKREVHLRQELKAIRQRHKIKSVQRTKHHMPVIAVVGYTNSGKTTLVKALSKDATMHPEDMLFATLDTTMHSGKLPCGLKVLYVDTIGFISDLPHDLVESFSSTLEDVIHADMLVHVRDHSHPQAYAQRANVLKVLAQLDLRPGLIENMVEVINKVDILDTDPTLTGCTVPDYAHPISALHGSGLAELLRALEQRLLMVTKRRAWHVAVPANGPELSWLYRESEATVCNVQPALQADSPLNPGTPQDEAPPTSDSMDILSVTMILTDGALSRFHANFSGSKNILFTEVSIS